MERLILYLVLIVLLLAWVYIFVGLPGLQPILIIITIGGFAVGCCGRKLREGM
jgi:hypothetical protein